MIQRPVVTLFVPPMEKRLRRTGRSRLKQALDLNATWLRYFTMMQHFILREIRSTHLAGARRQESGAFLIFRSLSAVRSGRLRRRL